ncbi:MAG: NAD(P)-dependent oxidoreductase [Elusimicrobiaceae bacterium]|jgi:D-lactate dehydrogenase
MKPDVIFYEAFEEEQAALKKYLPAGINAVYTRLAAGEGACEDQPPARVISIRTQSVIPARWKLDAVLSRTTGYDVVERYLSETGQRIPCGYLPKYCARAVAEQAMLLWMALLRRLPRQIEQFKTFNRDGITGRECSGKSLLVCGVGNIGSEIHAIGKGLAMRVRGVDIAEKFGDVEYVSLEEGISGADIIAVSMNLTSENKGLFSQKLLKRAKRGAIFVNVARGELSPCAELLPLLKEGVLGAAGLDVYNNEPELGAALRSGRRPQSEEASAAFEMAAMENVIFTPHNAFNTIESVERKAEQSARQLEEFFRTGGFIWPVPQFSGEC